MDRKARRELEQAVWLADSVLEFSQNQARADDKRVKEICKTYTDAIDGIDGQGLKLLNRFGVKPPLDTKAVQAAGSSSEEEAKAAEEVPEIADAQAKMSAEMETAQQRVAHLKRLFLPGIFVGVTPLIALFMLCLVAGIAAQASRHTLLPDVQFIAVIVGATLVGSVLLGLLLRMAAHRQVLVAYKPLVQSLGSARRASAAFAEQSRREREAKYAYAVKKRDREVRAVKGKAAPVINGIAHKRNEDLAAADSVLASRLAAIEARHNASTQQVDNQHAARLAALAAGGSKSHLTNEQKRDALTQESRCRYDEARVSLERRLEDGLKSIRTPINEASQNGHASHAWNETYWTDWTPPKRFPSMLRFGELNVDLKSIANQSKQSGEVRLNLPAPFIVPAALAFPRGASLLVQHERSGREPAMRLLQTVMARVFTSLPPGRARFTIIDPVGLGQNFAGFMHLADHDEALVGARIWTEADQIEQRLADMTEHMETVIQKYLRNEYSTIDEYNAQAGELAEPYRFVVVADFPNSFQGEAFRRLASIAATGARCGVYVLVARDLRVPLPNDAALDDLEAHCVNLKQQGDQFVWQDDVFGQFPLSLDDPPPENVLTQLLDRVGRAARESKRVEVSFDTIAPNESEFWTGNCTDELSVPIGRMGATRLQTLRFGRGVAQHALVAGKTGSGKSTLLHALVTNVAMWYSPDQVEMYLIDFKKGVEFKTYAVHNLPHARAIAVESDREFGVSVLQRLDAELARRGEIFRTIGVQDLGAYRRTPGAKSMPRTLLIIDEFQEFFSEDDRLAQEASLLLDRLVRQGRAFGIHLLLGSQTIGGSSGLARTTIGQMAVRIALQTSEADSQLILGDNNSAARLLSRPGEAIYNDAGGLVEANSPFQVAWLPDERRDVYLDKVNALVEKHKVNLPPAVVFEGNAAADIRMNAKMKLLREAPAWSEPPAVTTIWLGEPVAIKDPTSILLRRQSGANVLMVGQQEEQAMAVLASSLFSAALQFKPGSAEFYILDGTPADSALAGTFARLKESLPQGVDLVEWRAVPETIDKIAQEIAARQAGDPAGKPEIFIFLYGLQRYRLLRRSDDDFGFSMGEEAKKANPAKQFAEMLRDGPGVGVHVLTWVDTVASLERTLDRTSMREFDNRVLFQMSAADSSTLIDSPVANKLGFHRALFYSEEQGVIEKFRPYAVPATQWLASISDSLKARKS